VGRQEQKTRKANSSAGLWLIRGGEADRVREGTNNMPFAIMANVDKFVDNRSTK
jgi:hypothetical protein